MSRVRLNISGRFLKSSCLIDVTGNPQDVNNINEKTNDDLVPASWDETDKLEQKQDPDGNSFLIITRIVILIEIA